MMFLLAVEVQHKAIFPVFSPHSGYARSIDSLSIGVLWTMLAILLLVAGLVTYSVHRFRERPDSPQAKLTYGNTKLEVVYTVGFVVILGVISVFSLRSMQASDPEKAAPDDVVVVGHQWWWEVRYPTATL